MFVDHIFKLHGMPTSIVSDRDPIFLSNFWKEFFKLQGSKLNMSSGYHPQSDGQTEVLNRCLETYLRCFVGLQPKKWVQWLTWAKWSYNSSYHTASMSTPFELVYGFPPLHIVAYEIGSAKLDIVEKGLMERDKMLAFLKSNLEVAQNRMKVQADKHKTEREFSMGDFVYLKLVPYQLQALNILILHKLHPKYFGPFEVLERIGKMAYKLKLPANTKIHPVFHVSVLKKYLGEKIVPTVSIPEEGLEPNSVKEPMAVLQKRVYKREMQLECKCWCSGRIRMLLQLRGMIMISSSCSSQIFVSNLEDKVFVRRG